MSWRMTATYAIVRCDFPDCKRSVMVRLGPNCDVHCADHVRAAEEAASEGWQAPTTGHGPDLCTHHNRALDAWVDALVAEAQADGCTPDRAKVRAVMEKSLRKIAGGAS